MDIVRIYLDRNSNIYPLHNYVFNSKKFVCKNVKNEDNIADRKGYFNHNPDELKIAMKPYGVNSFIDLQNKLLFEYANTINHSLQNDPKGKLVILIHGFNCTSAEDDFKKLRTQFLT